MTESKSEVTRRQLQWYSQRTADIWSRSRRDQDQQAGNGDALQLDNGVWSGVWSIVFDYVYGRCRPYRYSSRRQAYVSVQL